MSEASHKQKIEKVFVSPNINHGYIDDWISGRTVVAAPMHILISNSRYLDLTAVKKKKAIFQRFVRPGNLVLDCGCGTGYYLNFLRQHLSGEIELIGVDISENALKVANKRLRNSCLVGGDATCLPFADDCFDVVFSIALIEHVPNPQQVINECLRVLKPGGIFIFFIHKPFIDPLIFPSLVLKIYGLIWRRPQAKHSSISFPLDQVRAASISLLRRRTTMRHLSLLDRSSFIYAFEWAIYQKIYRNAPVALIWFGRYLNKLRLEYYKNFEYYVYRKQRITKSVIYILETANYYSPPNIVGGHIAHIIGVIEGWQNLGYKVKLAAYERVPGWNNDQLSYRLFPKMKLRLPLVSSYIEQSLMHKQIFNLINRESPRLVYIRWQRSIARTIRRKFPDIPIVIECNTPAQMYQEMTECKITRQQARRIDRANIEVATLVSVVSQEIKDFLLQHHPDIPSQKIVVNPNGVNTDRFRPVTTNIRRKYRIAQQAVVVGYAGNFCSWHRIELLIQAIQNMDLDHLYLLIIGTGTERLCRSLEHQARQYRREQIVFTGSIPFAQMPYYLCACDILVSPQSASIAGKLHQSPIKLYEYMAVSRAIVASNIGQISRVIRNGENGLLFRPGSLSDLQAKLETLIHDPALRLRLARQARIDAEKHHSWSANLRRILQGLARLSSK